jgi:hypothetical protein
MKGVFAEFERSMIEERVRAGLERARPPRRCSRYPPGFEMASGNILNQREITVQIDGRTITGVYTVWSGMITVSTPLGKKTTQVGGSGSAAALDGLARIILRELVLEGKA